MFQTCLTLACISRGRCMSKTCLTLALIMWSMHVPDMSYTSTHITQCHGMNIQIYSSCSTGSLYYIKFSFTMQINNSYYTNHMIHDNIEFCIIYVQLTCFNEMTYSINI
ncbi:hypothetical protein V6Z11_A10G070000 [Gossypium hirsutum]